jgi:hypothetical protein
MSDNPQAPRQVPKHASGGGYDLQSIETRARAAYEREWPDHDRWEDLPEILRGIWRAHVTTGLPPR